MMSRGSSQEIKSGARVSQLFLPLGPDQSHAIKLQMCYVKGGMRYPVLALLLLLFVQWGCAIVSEETPYVEKSFAMEADETRTVAVQVDGGDTLEGFFSVSGEDVLLDFWIQGPNRELAYDKKTVEGTISFQMVAQYPGTYTMYFDTRKSRAQSTLQIDLSYRS